MRREAVWREVRERKVKKERRESEKRRCGEKKEEPNKLGGVTIQGSRSKRMEKERKRKKRTST